MRKIFSHTRIQAKNELLKEIIKRLDKSLIPSLQPILKRVANLFNQETEPLALFVRETLNKMHQTTHHDLSANEELEIARLPADKFDISVANSPYLLYRHNDRGIARIFVRYLLTDVATIIAPEAFSSVTYVNGAARPPVSPHQSKLPL